MAVTRDPGQVRLSRLAHDSGDSERLEMTWRVSPGAGAGSEVELTVDARLDVPRLLPLGGVGDAVATGFVGAAIRELERERVN